MALYELKKIYSGQRLEDQTRIDFDIEADLGNGWSRFVYTYSPFEAGNIPLATNIYNYLQENKDVHISYFKWAPPSKEQLEDRLKQVIRKTKLRDYLERQESTDGREPIPEDVKAKANYARQKYNLFKDNIASIPRDWEKDKHWYEGK